MILNTYLRRKGFGYLVERPATNPYINKRCRKSNVSTV